MQLDLFEHSKDVMLRNDAICALQRNDLDAAHLARQALVREYPNDTSIFALDHLLKASRQRPNIARYADHQTLRADRLALVESVTPMAELLMGCEQARHWVLPFWQTLIQAAAYLPFKHHFEQEHAAPMLLGVQDWQGTVAEVASIASWRQIPAPLAWMTRAKLELLGLNACWGLLAELAWLSPKRFDALVAHCNQPILLSLKQQFDAEFEPSIAGVAASGDGRDDAAWFPAWVLTQQPRWVTDLALAQSGQHGPPEQAMRLLVELLGLERQGRHHDIVARRKQLRDLHPYLFQVYMQQR